MSMSKIMMGFAMILVLGSTSDAATATSREEMPPPPPLFHMLGLSGICATQENLYVMADGKLLQYSLDLKLVKTVTLPEPVPPSGTPPQNPGLDEPPMFPPPPAPPHGLWAGDGVLYVLAGPGIYRYTIPALELQTSVELPQPELTE